jgi:hypothetical protein
VGDVFHGKIAASSRDNPEAAMGLYLRVLVGLLTIGSLPMLLVALYGERLFVAVLGVEWSVAGEIAAAITPWILLQFAVNPVSRIVLVYQGQELKLLYDMVGLASIVGVFWWGGYRQLSVVEACTMLGGTQAAAYAVYAVLLAVIIKRREKINYQLES